MENTSVDRAVAVLRAGGLVAFPTETVYGLGADASNPEAVERIYAVKGRPRHHPLIVHIAGAQRLKDWAREVPPAAGRLAQRFWPGPLTLILKRAENVSVLVTGGQDTVALRCPSQPLAQALLHAFDGGIAAPSANRYGRVSATAAEHVISEFGDEIEYVLDGGPCEVGIESTILDVSGSRPALLRPGSILAEELEAVLRMPLVPGAAGAPRVPGSGAKHYAPTTRLVLTDVGRLRDVADQMVRHGHRIAVLARSVSPLSLPGLIWVAAPLDPAGYARSLYACLRELDRAGCSAILVEQPPLEPAWAAIQDRLRRAAAGPGAPDVT